MPDYVRNAHYGHRKGGQKSHNGSWIGQVGPSGLARLPHSEKREKAYRRERTTPVRKVMDHQNSQHCAHRSE